MDDATAAGSIEARVAALPWPQVGQALDAEGHGLLGPLLGASECSAIAARFDDPAGFRSHIVMARHGFGQGEYKYFAAPLPPEVGALRRALYAGLVPTANRWRTLLGEPGEYPATLDAFTAQCHAAGQTRPTPLLLRYGPGDFNRLHQDRYGALLFPIQVVILLSDPAEFEGGALVLVEQKPRAQSRAEVVTLGRGEAVAFAVHHRPAQGVRGIYRVMLRHGVSTIRAGTRSTLGIIFHDAA
jgi:hypothetical protein